MPGVPGRGSFERLDIGQESGSAATGTEIHKAGWVVFSVMGEIRKAVVGLDKQKAFLTAFQQVIESPQLQDCNCLEIAEVTMASFLRVYCVTVTAHSRHLQQKLGMSTPIKLRMWNGTECQPI